MTVAISALPTAAPAQLMGSSSSWIKGQLPRGHVSAYLLHHCLLLLLHQGIHQLLLDVSLQVQIAAAAGEMNIKQLRFST